MSDRPKLTAKQRAVYDAVVHQVSGSVTVYLRGEPVPWSRVYPRVWSSHRINCERAAVHLRALEAKGWVTVERVQKNRADSWLVRRCGGPNV